MKRFILLIVFSMCVALTSGCQTIEKEKTIDVNATVTDKRYRSSYVTMTHMRIGKTTTLVPQPHPERYLVTISYENVSETFDDKDLYENVEVKDTIQMVLYKGYDRDDNLIEQKLQLPE